jgi:CRP-like cAMP-binding protein
MDYAAEMFIRKLESISRLSPSERHEVAAIVGKSQVIEAHKDIVQDGTSPSHSSLLVSGMTCRYKMLPEGRRQMLSFHIGGDVVDLYSFVLRKMDHSIATLTTCSIAPIEHSLLTRLLETYPHLGKMLWRDTLVDSSIYREWMINIGRRTAEQRLGHLVCEMFIRMRAVDLASGDSFPFPVTQTDLADCLGISLVHVNRVIKKLKEDNLLRFDRSSVIVDSWDRLFRFSEFDPKFLHLNETEHA